MKKHRTVWGLVAVVAGAALLLGGAAVASNMGFKFVPQIPGTAGNNAFNLSLPWNNNYTNAASLFNDIPGCSRVSKFNTNSTLSSWNAGGGMNFTIVKGEAYIVFGAGSGQTPVIVGSHDPNFTFSFPNGAYNASAPYHQTYTNASALFTALQGTCPTQVVRVSKFNANSTLSSWNAGGGMNFNLDLGAGVLVFTNAPCSGFVWAHY